MQNAFPVPVSEQVLCIGVMGIRNICVVLVPDPNTIKLTGIIRVVSSNGLLLRAEELSEMFLNKNTIDKIQKLVVERMEVIIQRFFPNQFQTKIRFKPIYIENGSIISRFRIEAY